MKIKCALVDDEPLAIKVLENHIEKIENMEIVARCSNAMEVLEALKDKQIDIVFLDIQMPHLTGIDMLKTLQNPPTVVITTAYRNYAVDAFELDVLDYLLKPITFERFLKAVNKFHSRNARPLIHHGHGEDSQHDEAYIYIKRNKTMIKILLKDIIFIESLKEYIRIHTDDESLMTKQKLGLMEEKLPDNQFIRIHKSFLVAINRIKSVSPSFIGLTNDKNLPIGRSYKAFVLNKLNYNKNV